VVPPQSATVQVADADNFAPGSIVADGLIDADEQGVLKVQVSGLPAGSQLFYRFQADDEDFSSTGTFRTAPPTDEPVPFRFTISGDSSISRAPFYVLASAAEETADFHLWFGDTIYGDVPGGGLGVARTLEEYRAKYLTGRSDPFLRQWLASGAFWVGWDDHEVRNDYDGGEPEPGLTREQIEAGYQAFFEWMPIANPAVPGDPFRTYRRFRYGQLAEFFLIDGRQYRDGDLSDECNNEPDPFGFLIPALFRPGCTATLLHTPQTMLGPTQLDWLLEGLSDSQARFKFIINNVPMATLGILPYDRWDGYDHERKQILQHIDRQDIRNVIILTTDLHMNLWTPDVTHYLRLHRPDYLLSPTVRLPEAIMGPIAMTTAEEAARDVAGNVAGELFQGDLGESLLDGLQTWAEQRITRLIGAPFVDTNQFSYLVVDVDADEVRLTWKGIPPSTNVETPADTLYEAAVPDRSNRPGLPCAVLPILAAVTGVVTVTAMGRTRLRRSRVSRSGLRHCEG
jgi:alkaline phosphatase D